jgi:sorbitol-6-phosphate 2-dehydrogenase
VSAPLTNQVAIVTGGGQGLGQAICRRLAQAGASVAVADLNADTAAATAGAIAAEAGARTLPMAVDVTDEAQVAALVQAARDAFGRVDILVANAGIVISGDVTAFDAAQWRKVVEVNLTGYFLCAKYVVPVMREQGSGVIVQINSISGKRGSFRNSAYCAAKAAGIGLTQSLALELADSGVRVNAVCPGHLLDSPLWVNTLFKQYAVRFGVTEAEVRRRYVEAVPMKRACTYDDVCNVVLFLCSEQSGYMTGQAINVTGGQQMT